MFNYRVSWANGKSRDLPWRHWFRFSKEIRDIRREDLVAFCRLSRQIRGYLFVVKVKVNQSHYYSEVPRGFQEVKVPRLRDNSPGWW